MDLGRKKKKNKRIKKEISKFQLLIFRMVLECPGHFGESGMPLMIGLSCVSQIFKMALLML